jgi:hypothetical protein
MRNTVRLLLPVFAVALVLMSESRPAASQTVPSVEAPWPRTIARDGYDILIYQPQIERWQGNHLEARSAVSIAKETTPAPTLGVVWFSASTSVDRSNDLVALENIKVDRVSFPSAPDDTDEYAAAIRAHLPVGARTISLPRLKAELAIGEAEKQSATAVRVKNDPPRIIYSATPAMLVLIDGKPVLRPVPGTRLLRAINTRALILLDEVKGEYYLRALGRWIQAPDIEGPWTQAKSPPASLETALKAAGKDANLLEQPGPDIAEAVKQGVLPAFYVSQTPAELLQSTGQAEYAPIAGTDLLYVRNMSSHLLIDTSSQDHYVLISGRWFRSRSLADGQWEFVANDNLPADFAKIPESHQKGDVLAAVSGTPQSIEALIDNQIPQTAAVDRKKTSVKIAYDGSPQFRPIEGTSLRYAANSPTPVILAENGRYYAVDNGIWFTATAPGGPWTVADEVPAEIYSIPADSPLHNVSYVRIYDSTPEYVYVGYTPGYYGTVVAPGGVVYYGTGYYYPSWIGAYWYPWLPTYGFGTGFFWGAATGFAFGAIANAVWHGGPWGWDRDFNIHNDFNFSRDNVYDRWDRDTVRAHVDPRDHERFQSGQRDRVADREGKLGNQDRRDAKEGRAVAADRGEGLAGKGEAKRRDAALDKGKGSGLDKSKAAGKAKDAAKQTKGQPHRDAHKDLYAGKDGHVYKRDAAGWQKHDGKQFAHASQGDHAQLNRAQNARHRGDAMHAARPGGGQANLGARGGGPRPTAHVGGGGGARAGGGGRGGGGRGGGGRR